MRTPSRAGFTVLELVVATVVLLLAFVLGIGLLQQSQAAVVNASLAARDPLPDFALTVLRRDLRSARGIGVTPWPGGLALQSAAQGPGQVVYLKRLDRLERLSANGRRQVLMTGVRDFVWWEAGSQLVEIRITYERKAEATVHVLANPNRLRNAISTLETVQLQAAFRAGDGRRW